MKDPKTGIDYVPYEAPLVNAIDMLIDVAKKFGSKDNVKTSGDWKTLEFTYKLWEQMYPAHASRFISMMKEWRKNSKLAGIAKEHGGAMIQHQLELPQKLHQMIKIIFPLQVWDRKFVKAFSEYFPQFKGSDAKL